MGLLARLFNRQPKALPEPNQFSNDSNMYDNLGIIQPFTALTSSQLSNFLSQLSQNQELTLTEQEAFTHMWNDICVSQDGHKNAIWTLKNGTFKTFDKDNITIQFEKKPSGIDKYKDEGRANFVYKSPQGHFIINQNERNKDVFLIYTSEKITEKLFRILRKAEAKALELKEEKSFVPKVDTIPTPSTSNRELNSSSNSTRNTGERID